MSFFESLVLLLLVAILLLQFARRASLPYPAMLALAGVGVAFVPGAPSISIDPGTILALFVAPVLLEAGYDFPLATARLLWKPMTVMVAGAVLATTAIVALIGWWMAGLPIAAACVLGAIVAPPDAAAAVAVLGSVSLPRRTVELLKGESLFNDAIALLVFGAALAIQSGGGLTLATAVKISVAVPGGLLLGIALGFVISRMTRFVANTLGGNLLQFLNALVVWIIADFLHLSAVLAVVACAMTVASSPSAVMSPRMRIHSFAVWSSVTFLLNVLAFLLMGMQAHAIVTRLPPGKLAEAAGIAGIVVVAVIVTRMLFVLTWNRLTTRFTALRGRYTPPTIAQVTVVGWSGMRGLVTLATAFALPAGFPQRDLVVLVAFAVVLATLVLQGLTLAPLIRALGLDRMEDTTQDVAAARRRLSAAATEQLHATACDDDLNLATFYALKSEMTLPSAASDRLERFRRLGLSAIGAQRAALERMRADQGVDMDIYYLLLEEIDWRELTYLPDEERRISEI